MSTKQRPRSVDAGHCNLIAKRPGGCDPRSDCRFGVYRSPHAGLCRGAGRGAAAAWLRSGGGRGPGGEIQAERQR